MKRHSPIAGFTLFEMVVAVGIFMLMGAIAFPGLTHMAKTGQAVGEANQRISELQFALSYFSRDWSQVVNRKIRNRFGDEGAQIVIEENSISFTRGGRSNVQGLSRSNLQRVRYGVTDNQLIRQHWTSVDQGIGEEAYSVVLLKDVSNFEIYFIDKADKKVESWPPLTANLVDNPIALNFAVELDDMGLVYRILEVPAGAF